MTISVIIPIFNVQNYLRQCLDSLFSQPERPSLEIILVNDGSTDGCLEICKEYLNKTSITRLIETENCGLSEARNKGLEIATGDYCYFLDSDDYLAPNAISRLYSYAVENDCDVVQGGYYYAFDKYLLYDNRWLEENANPFVLTHKEAMTELVQQHIIKNFAWGKLYKTDIVRQHPFKKGVYYEDSFWQHSIIHETRRYGVVPAPLYYYRQNRNSISGSFSIKALDLLAGNEERLCFIRSKYPDLLQPMTVSFWRLVFQFNRLAQRQPIIEVKDAFREFSERVYIQYKDLFDVALKGDILYRLNELNIPILTDTWISGQRVFNHFFAKRLKKVEIE